MFIEKYHMYTLLQLDSSPVCPMQLDAHRALLVLTNGTLHRVDPRAPPSHTRGVLTVPPAQCMSSVVDHMLAIGHSRGATMHDLRMSGSPVLHARQGVTVFDVHADRFKLVTLGGVARGSSSGVSMRNTSIAVCSLPAADEVVDRALGDGVGEAHVTAMACRGTRLVVGTWVGSVAVHDYRYGRGGDEADGRSMTDGRSKFWRSPSLSEEEEDEED